MRYETLQRWFIFTVLLLLLFVGVFVYAMFIKPSIQGYVIQKQLEASNFVLTGIIDQVQKQGYVEIRVGDEQSLILIPYVPNQPNTQQLPTAQQTAQPSATNDGGATG